MLRDFLDSILDFIGSSSLTDDEYNGIDTSGLTEDYTYEVYLALRGVIEAREGVSGQAKKLKSLFIAKGVDITGTAKTPVSQILIGGEL